MLNNNVMSLQTKMLPICRTFLTLCRSPRGRFTLGRVFDPMSFDSMSFYSMSFYSMSFYSMSFDSMSFDPMAVDPR